MMFLNHSVKSHNRISGGYRTITEDSSGHICHRERQEAFKPVVHCSITWAWFVCWFNHRKGKQSKVHKNDSQSLTHKRREGSSGDSSSSRQQIHVGTQCYPLSAVSCCESLVDGGQVETSLAVVQVDVRGWGCHLWSGNFHKNHFCVLWYHVVDIESFTGFV